MNENTTSTASMQKATSSSLLPTLEAWWPHVRRHLALLTFGPLTCGLLGLGATYLSSPIFTARTTFLPPQAQQSGMSSALASLGAMAGLPSTGTGRGTPDQYVAMLLSVTIADRIVQHFDLQSLYKAEFKVSARRALSANVRIASSKKDGLIAIEVDDTNPQRAADIANRFVEELRQLTGGLAVTEAQQRRVFFDRQLAATRDKLTKAQLALQSSGFSGGSLRTEPKSTAEAYARLKAESVAAETRVNTLRTSMAPGAIELQQAEAVLASLRQQLARVEDSQGPAKAGSTDYVERYREFKYQETLFELFARQLELARADEAREGPLIQVVDAATPPEVKSWPKRLNAALTWTLLGLLLSIAMVALRPRR